MLRWGQEEAWGPGPTPAGSDTVSLGYDLSIGTLERSPGDRGEQLGREPPHSCLCSWWQPQRSSCRVSKHVGSIRMVVLFVLRGKGHGFDSGRGKGHTAAACRAEARSRCLGPVENGLHSTRQSQSGEGPAPHPGPCR